MLAGHAKPDTPFPESLFPEVINDGAINYTYNGDWQEWLSPTSISEGTGSDLYLEGFGGGVWQLRKFNTETGEVQGSWLTFDDGGTWGDSSTDAAPFPFVDGEYGGGSSGAATDVSLITNVGETMGAVALLVVSALFTALSFWLLAKEYRLGKAAIRRL